MGQAFEQGNGERILLDTSVCVEILKHNQSVIEHLGGATGISSPLISSVTVFELMLRNYNLSKAEEFVADTDVIDFDKKLAVKASEIARDLKSKGTPVESRDIFIAATAIVNNCALATLNVKDFSKVKGLKLVKIS